MSLLKIIRRSLSNKPPPRPFVPPPDKLLNVDLPDENPEVAKKHIFQQLTKVKTHDAVYTLEQAAQTVPSDYIQLRWKYPAVADNLGKLEYSLRSWDNQHSVIVQFPDLTDFLMVGGGLIGSATAYYAKKATSRCADVVVIDKDPYSPHNCTAISNGLISCQSKSQDVSRMASLSKELIRNLKSDVLVEREDFAKIKYRPCTHLILWQEKDLEEVMASTSNLIEDGCFTEAKLPEELEATFPWLRAKESNIALGTHGNQDEAIVDPIALRNLYRTLAQAHGANFIQAEGIEFNSMYNKNNPGIHPHTVGALIARLTSGELKQAGFAKTLLCLGHSTPFLEERSELEEYMRASIEDLHFLQPKLRICFYFSSMNGPIINFPVITDVDGTMLMRDYDYAGNYKFYITLEEGEKFLDDDIELFMDLESENPYQNRFHKGQKFQNYFDAVIKPKLVNRIPRMEDATFRIAESGFESYNINDGNPVLGVHPYHSKVMLSGGYGNRLLTIGPAAAAALSELLIYDEEMTFDVTNFYWERFLKGRTIREFASLLG